MDPAPNRYPYQPTPEFKVSPENDVFKLKIPSKSKKIASAALSALILPLGAAKGAKNLAGKLILPAQILKKSRLDEARMEAIETVNKHPSYAKFKFERLTIETADKVKLDTLKIIHPNITKEPNEQKWLVFLAPNGNCYEGLIYIAASLSRDLGINIYLGNYRGVGYSKKSPNEAMDLVVDGETMVQYLFHLGVLPENIMVHGWSLGGAVATEVAALHQEEDHEMKLSNDRSFNSLYEEIISLFSKFKLGSTLAVSADALGWSLNPGKAWQAINEDHKVVAYHKDDKMISYEASLHANQLRAKREKESPEETEDFKHVVEYTEKVADVHNIELSSSKVDDTYQLYVQHIREILDLEEVVEDSSEEGSEEEGSYEKD